MEGLKRMREERGWSQQKLADASGVNKATINQIERGRRSPNVETLEKLASALGAEVADFFPKAQAPLPFDAGAEQWRDGDIEQDYARTIDSWTLHMRLRAESWETELGFWDDLSGDLPGLTRWFEEVEREASALLAAAERTLWASGRRSGPAVASSLAEHLGASREVDAAAQRISEQLWSAVEAHHPGDPGTHVGWGSRFGGLREAAETAARERGKLIRRIEERQRRSA